MKLCLGTYRVIVCGNVNECHDEQSHIFYYIFQEANVAQEHPASLE